MRKNLRKQRGKKEEKLRGEKKRERLKAPMAGQWGSGQCNVTDLFIRRLKTFVHLSL